MCVDISNNLKSLKMAKSSGGGDQKKSQKTGLLENSLSQLTEWNSEFLNERKNIPRREYIIPGKNALAKMIQKAAPDSPKMEKKYASSRKILRDLEDVPQVKTNSSSSNSSSSSSTITTTTNHNIYYQAKYQQDDFSLESGSLTHIGARSNKFYTNTGSYQLSPIQSRSLRIGSGNNATMRPFLTPKPVRIPYSPSLSHRVTALNQKANESKQTSCQNSATNSPILPYRGITVAAIKQRLFNQGLRIDMGSGSPNNKRSTKYRDYFRRLNRSSAQVSQHTLFMQANILKAIFSFLSGKDLLKCARVCQMWNQKLAQWRYFDRVKAHIDFRRVQQQLADGLHSNEEALIIPILNMTRNRHINAIQMSNMSDKYCASLLAALNTFTDTMQHTSSEEDLSSMSMASPQADPMNNQIPASSSTSSAASRESDDSSSGIGSSLSAGTGTLPTTTAACYEGSLSTRSSASTTETIRPLIMPKNGSSINLQQKENVLASQMMENDCKVSQFRELCVVNCAISDRSLERLVNSFPDLRLLEIRGCNDLSEMALWTILQPGIRSLTVEDCINFSDDSFTAICQLLPELRNLRLQSYHLSDASMSLFSQKQREELRSLCLTQCMDLTNQGIVNMAQTLKNLRYLSLSGCSKLTDDGLDVLCETLKSMLYLDLSWCPKITDSGLECVACDLYQLKVLILDR
ncbi:F-box/LRR-repeat protein 16 [Cichlidogyrus casuarinus]|uniref:F-box/LRR-repeat protein 16 n=1 Tax=Cichlidogyrus casuarinus TaxID=1844966 RepID=A0ABD2QMA1_9PLAT